jgi:drug/metabolite transporter (DMT)-like permease
VTQIPTTVVLAVLCAAMMHATWNALIRGAPDKGLFTLLLHVCSALLACFGLIVVGLPNWESGPFLLMSALLHTVYIICLMRAYEGGQLAVSYLLMRGLAPLIVCVVSTPLLGETPSLMAWLGIAFILLGVLTIASTTGRSISEVIRHPSGKAALLNAIIIAAYTVVDGQGARVSQNPVGYVLTLALFEPLIILTHQLRRRHTVVLTYFKLHWRLGFLGAAVATSAYSIVLWAMTQAPIVVVAAMRESSVIFAVLIGSLWFREGRLRVGLIAASSMAIGVALIKS